MHYAQICGPDLITARMLKLFAHQIAPSLCQIFNQSLSEGKLPEEWKHANMTPILKDGNKSLVSSYHPISLLNYWNSMCTTCFLTT